MKVLCVQCLKLNELADDTVPGADGKVRFPCPHCNFVTVVTRKKAKGAAAAPAPAAAKGMEKDRDTAPPANRPRGVAPAGTPPPRRDPDAGKPAGKRNLEAELFDGSEKDVGDWMVRRLDGTEAGPLAFEELRQMIRDGDIGKIDEVRRMEERYVPAAFHELTAELFNELDMAGVSPPPKRG